MVDNTAPRTLVEAFQATAERHPDAVALRTPGDTVTMTWRQYRDRVQSIATGLASLGVGPGDTVALMLTNRPEFHLCDTAALHTGATPFSMYNTNPPEMLAYLYGNAGNRVVICERQFVPVVLAAREIGGKVEHVICVDGAPDGTIGLDELEARTADDFDFEARWQSVRPDDLLTIVYTSGTTGPPKGVELTHTNFLENARILDELGGLGSNDRVISYLPDAHAANRWFAHYANLLGGLQVTTLADLTQVVATLGEVRPTAFVAAPRVWVKVKAALESAVAEDPSAVKRALATWAFGVGRARARLLSQGRTPGLPLAVQHALAERLVLSKIRTKLGLDQVHLAVSGAAPISPEAHEFILGLGISLCEAYGQSECTAALTLTRPDRIKLGTVGKPVPGAEIRLAADGEVLARGPMIMRGYRNDPEKTAETIDSDGWLHTGDIGVLDAEGYLSIVDRKKEIIVNQAGKNMSPTNIENTVAINCALAGSVVVIGDARPYITALISLDPDAAAAFADKHALAERSLNDLAANPLVRERIQAGIDATNTKLSRVEQIKRYTIIAEAWTPGGDYLTPTGKLKRKPIATAYSTAIESMYS